MTFKEMDGKKAESGPRPNTNHPTRQQGKGVGNMLKPKEGLNHFLSPCSHAWDVWGYSETIQKQCLLEQHSYTPPFPLVSA